MPTCNRRYVGDIITKMRYSPKLVKKERKKFFITDTSAKDDFDFLGDFADYIILCAIICTQEKIITENEMEKAIDQIDGYIFAYEDGMISQIQAYNHLKENFWGIYNPYDVEWDFLITYCDKFEIYDINK